MMDRSKTIGLALVLSVLSTAVGFGFSQLVPQGERWLTDWQLTHMAPAPVDPSIVLVTAMENTSPALCGEGRWNFSVLEGVLLALHEAGATVIVSAINVPSSIPSECGGLPGLVRLAEVTKRVGSVIYPDSVPPILAEAAAALGMEALRPDEDGVFRRVMFSSLAEGSFPHPPIGLVIPSFMSKTAVEVSSEVIGNQVRFVGRWSHSPFPTYGFAEVWDIIQRKDRDQLANKFRGKAVILFSPGSMEPTLTTPWESAVPVAFGHAVVANAVLTKGWVFIPPLLVAFLVTGSVGILLALFLLRETSLTRLALKGLAGFLPAGLALFWGLHRGWVWPIGSTGLALGLTIGGAMAWRMFMSRVIIRRRVTQGRQQLRLLEKELAEKQHHVQELQTQLYSAQDHATQSATVIEGLQSTQGGVFRQLQMTQNEMEETRRQIDRLQEELENVRQQMPASPKGFPLPPGDSDSQALQQECASLQILTRDSSVLRVFQDLKKAAATQSPILLLGETGTGKEVFAKAAHALSPRHRGPFVS